MTDLSVCIVSFNTRELLKKCLESVYQNAPKLTFEVIVVDNASKDGTIEMVKKEFPKVYLIENKENLGLARATNQAIKRAGGSYILWLNSDTLVLPEALEVMIKLMDSRPDVGMLGPMIKTTDRSIQPSCMQKYPSLLATLLGYTYLHLFLNRIFRNSNWPLRFYETDERHLIGHEVRRLTGACLIIRREAVEKVGLMDENFFLYEEDTDYCKRFLDSGWKLYYTPRAKVIHYGAQSRIKLGLMKSSQYGLRSGLHYYKKHYGDLSVTLLRVIAPLASILGIILASVLWALWPSKRSLLKGLIDTNIFVVKWYINADEKRQSRREISKKVGQVHYQI